MFTVGVGTELVECVRVRKMIDQHGEQFLKRVFTDKEIGFCQARRHATEQFTACWAAKHAVRKALGDAVRKDVVWTEIEIHTDESGRPRVIVRGETRDLAKSLNVNVILISMSHTRNYAVAFATAVADEAGEEAKV
jgi:holo-[acyl-carrier protein] synthase